MKTMPRLYICLAGLLLLSACNDKSGSNAVQSNDMTEVVKSAVNTSPEDAEPIDIESKIVPAPEDTEPQVL